VSGAARSATPPEGRLANVSAAVLADQLPEPARGEAIAHTAELLERLFEEVVRVGVAPAQVPGQWVACGTAPLDALRAALEAGGAERVLIVTDALTSSDADLVLGLAAFPPHDAVLAQPRTEAPHRCAIYRREPVLRALQAPPDDRPDDLASLLARLEVAGLDADELGTGAG